MVIPWEYPNIYYIAYAAGAGSLSVIFLCFFSFLSGVGSCAAFAAAIKTGMGLSKCSLTSNISDTHICTIAANNFPDHRGSATAFPLAAFGLSAFGFSAISAMAFKDDTSEFLLLLALGPSLIIVVCTYFLQLLPPPPSYSAILNGEYPDSNLLLRTKPTENIQEDSDTDSNRAIASFSSAQVTAVLPSAIQPRPTPPDAEADETSSLMSRPRSLSDSGSFSQYDQAKHGAHAAGPDIRGLSLLPTPEFWQLFLLLGISTGVGLMTIK